MKLKLIFTGEEPLPLKVMMEVLSAIDRRLFEVEGKRILSVPRELPEVSDELVTSCLNRFEREYQAGGFSMLSIESVDYGSVDILAVVNAHAYHIVEMALAVAFHEAFRRTGMCRRLQKFFLFGQRDSLAQSVNDVADDYNRKNALTGLRGNSDKNERLKITSIPKEPNDGPHVLEVKVQRIVVKGPLTYQQLANEYNGEVPPRPETYTDNRVDE
jgi:hypothetical protein